MEVWYEEEEGKGARCYQKSGPRDSLLTLSQGRHKAAIVRAPIRTWCRMYGEDFLGRR
jgi:hypothetical protein